MQFGRYNLIRKIGAGGMAEIWKAKVSGPAGFEKVVAIKRVLPDLVEEQQSGFVEMFIAEAKLAAGLVHPNIVQVFDFGQIGKRDYFLAMEYVAGANLARLTHRLAQEGEKLPVKVALYLGAEIARGLGYAHAKRDDFGKELKIVHRDVSPQNILVSYGGEAKVADFGIAKVASTLTRTAEGQVRGKLAYMSPEQARTQPVDGRSDLFALGVVLFEAMSGRRFFNGSSSSEVYTSLLGYQAIDRALLECVPDQLRPILGIALQPDREKRFPDATAMEAAFALALGPRGAIDARSELAILTQKMFREELALETIVAAQAAQGAQAAAPLVGMEGLETGAPIPDAIPTVQTPTGLRGNSGITLAPSQAVLVGEPARSAPLAKRSPLLAPLAIGGVLAVLAAVFFAGRFMGGATPAPVASPTAVAVAPTSTPPPATATPTLAAVTATQLPHATARPQPTRVVVAPTPRPIETRASTGAPGTLSVTARPWVQVWVDGKMIAKETPLPGGGVEIPAGKHTLRVVNPTLQFDESRTFSMPSGGQIGFAVDVKAKTIAVK